VATLSISKTYLLDYQLFKKLFCQSQEKTATQYKTMPPLPITI